MPDYCNSTKLGKTFGCALSWCLLIFDTKLIYNLKYILKYI